MLPNGNVLIVWADEVKDLTREKLVVFYFPKPAENAEIGTAVRLEDGKVVKEIAIQP